MKRTVTLNPNRQFFYNFHHFLYWTPRDHCQNLIRIVDGKFWEYTVEIMAMWYPCVGNEKTVTLNPNRQVFYNFHHFLYLTPRDHCQNLIRIVDGKFWEYTVEVMAMWYPCVGNEKTVTLNPNRQVFYNFHHFLYWTPRDHCQNLIGIVDGKFLENTIEVMAMWYPCLGNEKDCNSKSKPPIFLQFSPLPIVDPKRSPPESHWNCRWQVLGINN